MRKTIAEMMKQGMSLEDIHAQVEEIFREEHNKKEAQIEAAFDRAAHALTDYVNLVSDEEMSVEEMKVAMSYWQMQAAPAPETRAKESAARLTRGVTEPHVEVFCNAVRNEEAEKALQKFLLDMGLIPQ